MTTVTIPSFDFTAFYYADILEALVQFKRLNVPEVTDESAQEPFMQLLRAFALVGHLNNTLADMIANECTLPTAQLVETVRNMLRLIDYEMSSATPAQADEIYELSQVLSTTQVVVPVNAQAEVSAQGDNPSIAFEALESLSCTRTDEFTGCLRENQIIQSGALTLNSSDLGITVSLSAGTFLPSISEGQKIRVFAGSTSRAATIDSRDSDTQLTLKSVGLQEDFTNLLWEIVEDDVFEDETTNINDEGAGYVQPFQGTVVLKDALYVGHAEAMWDQMDVTFSRELRNISGVWEYYDGDFRQTKPDSVTNLGDGKLKFDLSALLGSLDMKGSEIRVQLDATTAYEVGESEYDGSNFVVVSILGQTAPSTDADDYTVGSEWHILDIEEDGSVGLQQDGSIKFTLPQTLTQNWSLTTLNGVEAFWLRWRITNVADTSVITPQINRIWLDSRKQYVKRTVTQGRTQIDNPLGSSDGSANQEMETTQEHFIDGSGTLTVDGIEWTEVDNFLSSTSTDRHYRVELGENDRATVVFGDDVTGAIPPTGSGNVVYSYRYNAEVDGNVGASTISSDKTGLSYVNKLWNPRPAAGWAVAEGSTPESLARAKINGPASLRVLRTALNGDDAVILATQYEDEDSGAKPVARGKPIEEGFGPKTVELVLVGAGSTQLTNSQLDTLDTYFNGDPLTSPPLEKHFVANQEIVCTNFAMKYITLTGTITIEKNSAVTAAFVKNQLLSRIQPLALREDSALYEWEFGENVPVSRLLHEIFSTSSSILKVEISDLNGGGAPLITDEVILAIRELPVFSANSAFTIIEQT